MQEQRIEGSKIIERLVESSTSFNQKTKFSQEKFIKKKTKKYCQYIKIRRPSVRLILQIRSRDLPRMKTLNLREDSLAQIINTCNVRFGGKVNIIKFCSCFIRSYKLLALGNVRLINEIISIFSILFSTMLVKV